MKRTVPLAITFIVGIVLVIAYFIPKPPFDNLGSIATRWFQIIAAFAITLGIINLIINHSKKIHKRASGWGYSVALLLGFIIMAGCGVIFGIASDVKYPYYDYLFINVFLPLSATMFALLAFFIASAAFRAFRAKTFEATLLLVAAIIVMLGQVPIGDFLVQSMAKFFDLIHLSFIGSWLSKISLFKTGLWIMKVPNVAGQRAIIIGAALGAIAIAIKILLGFERTYLGREE